MERACFSLISAVSRSPTNPGRLVLALHRRADDLVERRLHAVELQLRHRGQDLGTLHHTALLRVS